MAGSVVERFLDRLEKVRPSGSGWTARCPAHKDHTPSLSVAEGWDGRVLIHCHAGCGPGEICSAVDLRLADLFPASTRRRPR